MLVSPFCIIEDIMKTKFAVAKKNSLHPTIYLANISFKMNEEGLSKFLNNFGKVTYLFMPTDKRTKSRIGTAFIQYSKKDEFEKALKVLNGKPFMGRTLKARIANENNKAQS